MKCQKSFLVLLIFLPVIINGQNNLSGVYAFDDSSYLAIGSLESKPMATFSDGNVRGIRRSGKNFEVGNALGLFDRIEGRIVKINRNTIQLTQRESSKIGRRMEFVEKRYRFNNKEVSLSGTLILPPGNGPFPCLVLTHGSGPETRDSNRGLAYLFCGYGIASFVYDKRFVGDEDENKWQDSFDNYADDAIAAANMLAVHQNIDSRKIGIFGHSQGGWVAPLAASKSPVFSFVIISAGNVVTPVEQHLYNGSCALRQDGVKEWVIEEIYKFRQIKYEAGITGSRIKYDSALPIAKERPWFIRTGDGIPTAKFWILNGYYDARLALKNLKCPVLVIAGELDKYSDTQRNMTLFRNIFMESKHPDVTYKIFPSANHAFLETRTGRLDETEWNELKKFADGYFQLLGSWVSEKTK